MGQKNPLSTILELVEQDAPYIRILDELGRQNKSNLHLLDPTYFQVKNSTADIH